MRFTNIVRAARPLLWLAVLCFTATGCTSKYGPQLTTANYYPQCYTPLAELREDENTTAKATTSGAVGGALIGALIGGLVTGKAEGALAGAVAGGATGAVAGHAYGKNQAEERDEQKLATYVSQLDGESAHMNRATAAAKVSTRCYDQQFKLAAADLKSGRITKQDFSSRYAEIRSGLEETSHILKTTASSMAQKDEEYQRVLVADREESQKYQASAAPASSKKSAGYRKASAKPSNQPKATPVAQSTQKWSQSRSDLEETQQQVDERLNGYNSTVDALLGNASGV